MCLLYHDKISYKGRAAKIREQFTRTFLGIQNRAFNPTIPKMAHVFSCF